ncbi:MAG: DNA polymerase III subunit gamma/tau [Solirubrobacteraceae bacterium]
MSSGPSLYRRHRPRTFDDVVGQEHVVRTLRNAVEQNKVHHAYLFVGSRGTGKTSMAKILASCLNCVNGPTITPCGVCESCVSIASASSLDVIEMDAASNNSVDDIRDLRESVAYAPVSGRAKVYILDEAHMLSSQAWNAFLKTLEEPPPNTIFVLATTEANKVLPTVVDRCHRFDFSRPTVEDIAGVVSRVATSEQIAIGPEAVGLLARHATGSFRDALGTLEQLVTYSGENIATADVLAVLGVADTDVLFGALDSVASGNAREAMLAVHRVAESGRDLSAFARDLETHARELLVVQTLGEVPPQVAMTPDHDARLAEQAQRVDGTSVVRLLDLLASGMKAVRDGADARTQLELALVKAATPEVDAGTRALLARIERLEGALAGGARPAPAPQPVAAPAPVVQAPTPTPAPAPPVAEARPEPVATPAPEPAVQEPEPEAIAAPVATMARETDLDGIVAVWPAVLDALRDENMALAAALAQGRPVELDGKELIVAFRQSDSFKRRKAESQSQLVGNAVRELSGASLRLKFEERDLADTDEAPTPAPTGDDLINRLKSEFDAEEILPHEEEPTA